LATFVVGGVLDGSYSNSSEMEFYWVIGLGGVLNLLIVGVYKGSQFL
jgi:hypothetical protein